MNNFSSLQNTLEDLREIVVRNQGANNETAAAVRQIQATVQEIERKARKSERSVLVPPVVQPVPVV